MGCSCRVTPLRIFIQGLTQVHHIESSFLRLSSQAAPSNLLVRQARALHATRYLRSEATASAPPTSPPRPEAASKTSSNDSDTSISSEASSEANPEKPRRDAIPHTPQKPVGTKPKSKNRWRASPDANPGDRTARKQWDAKNTKKPSGPRKPVVDTPEEERPKRPHWAKQKEALKEKFPEGWAPRKRLSPDALAGIRALNAQFPDVYTTDALAKKFEVSAENIRRILKSKWQPTVDEEQSRQERWFRRGMSVWERKAALGVKPPRKWRQEGVARDPTYHEWRQEATRKNKEFEDKENAIHREALRRRPAGGGGRSGV